MHKNENDRKRSIDSEAITILRRKQVEQKTGLARSTIYDRMKAGVFPKPIQLGNSRVVGWIESEVDEWLSSCAQKSRGLAS